mmetsp:Transcript_55761/g.178947  ORF Transcript_55761/g.178947 Transcript_55761/m.178947 type:complete len:250 (+) Transcript_55761:27-776(+)
MYRSRRLVRRRQGARHTACGATPLRPGPKGKCRVAAQPRPAPSWPALALQRGRRALVQCQGGGLARRSGLLNAAGLDEGKLPEIREQQARGLGLRHRAQRHAGLRQAHRHLRRGRQERGAWARAGRRLGRQELLDGAPRGLGHLVARARRGRLVHAAEVRLEGLPVRGVEQLLARGLHRAALASQALRVLFQRDDGLSVLTGPCLHVALLHQGEHLCPLVLPGPLRICDLHLPQKRHCCCSGNGRIQLQ